MMKNLLFILLLFLTQKIPLAQNNQVYVIEGLTFDGTSNELLSQSTILNKSKGILAISDDRGYFNIVIPYNLMSKDSLLEFDVIKEGYKPYKMWFSSYPYDSAALSSGRDIIWNWDIKMIRLEKTNTIKSSTSASHRRIINNRHGFTGIQDAFTEHIQSKTMQERLSKLKANNDNVLFQLDGKYVLSTTSSDRYFDNKKLLIYVDNTKVRISELNNIVKRNNVYVESGKDIIRTKKNYNIVYLKTKK